MWLLYHQACDCSVSYIKGILPMAGGLDVQQAEMQIRLLPTKRALTYSGFVLVEGQECLPCVLIHSNIVESDRQGEEMKDFFIIIKYVRGFQNNPRQTHHGPASFTFLCAVGGFDTKDENVLSKQCGLYRKALSTESS
ncbi:hypothetical protein E5288_WYG012846 [Bos mutus]|uniref:Uncharacterized protein n=1 Tax=Bos mutus TaxID=72004 RepID=A0A6B0QVG5_9CETA|nr:hypothetical protein [Bos mutus]